jgi:DoxX-like protein
MEEGWSQSLGRLEKLLQGKEWWMGTGPQLAPCSRKMLWAGRTASALPIVMLLFSGGMKLVKPALVVQEFDRLGHPECLVLGIGFLELASTVVYMIPRTTVLGAILMTAYLGGATATHVRISD